MCSISSRNHFKILWNSRKNRPQVFKTSSQNIQKIFQKSSPNLPKNNTEIFQKMNRKIVHNICLRSRRQVVEVMSTCCASPADPKQIKMLKFFEFWRLVRWCSLRAGSPGHWKVFWVGKARWGTPLPATMVWHFTHVKASSTTYKYTCTDLKESIPKEKQEQTRKTMRNNLKQFVQKKPPKNLKKDFQ